MTDRGRPLAVPAGLFVPERWCAVLQDALKDQRHPMLAELQRAAYQAAQDFTARQAEAAADASGLTVADAAVLLGVTPGRVRQLLRSGDLDGQQGAGRIWRITRKSAERRRDGQPTRAPGRAAAGRGRGPVGGR